MTEFEHEIIKLLKSIDEKLSNIKTIPSTQPNREFLQTPLPQKISDIPNPHRIDL